MSNATTRFFEGLEARGHEPRLEKVKASLRFDLTNGKQTNRWHVAIDKGEIAVSHKNAKADCVVRADSSVFDGIASGEVNPVAAVLRGAIAIEGDPELLMLLRRLSPAPGRSHERWSRQDSRRQHLRRQRLARRHRGLGHRPDRPPSRSIAASSTWILTVDGQRLNPLSVDDLQYFESWFFLVPGTGTVYVDAKLSVIRRRRRRRVPRGAHDPQPRHGTGGADRPRRGRKRLRRPLRGEGRAEEEGQVLGDRGQATAAADLRARHKRQTAISRPRRRGSTTA